MPFGYLATVILGGLFTLLALAPPRRPRLLAALGFRLGLVFNELPFLEFYYLIAATVLAAVQGDLASPGGAMAFGLMLVVLVELAIVVHRGRRTGPTIDRAFVDELGPYWRDTVDPALAARLPRRVRWDRILLRPFPLTRHTVRRARNISYGDAGQRNLLDVYWHRSRPTGAPVLIHFHGGGFTSGRKSTQSLPLIHRLASRGWVCVSANYRLAPAKFPDYLIDAKKVIAWVREHGAEYGADPSMVFVSGSSAGAHLAAMCALTPGDARFQPGFADTDTAVRGAICLNGYFGPVDTHEPQPSSPLDYVSADAPPIFVAHGDRDSLVAVQDVRVFVDRLRGASARPVVYAELPGAQHAFDLFPSVRFETVVNAVEAFTAWVRAS